MEATILVNDQLDSDPDGDCGGESSTPERRALPSPSRNDSDLDGWLLDSSSTHRTEDDETELIVATSSPLPVTLVLSARSKSAGVPRLRPVTDVWTVPSSSTRHRVGETGDAGIPFEEVGTGSEGSRGTRGDSVGLE